MRTAQCPKCGKPLSVAEGIPQVTCQQCGAPLKVNVAAEPPQAMKQPSPPPPNPHTSQPRGEEKGAQPAPLTTSVAEGPSLGDKGTVAQRQVPWALGSSPQVFGSKQMEGTTQDTNKEPREQSPAQAAGPAAQQSPAPPSEGGKIWYAAFRGEKRGPLSSGELALLAQASQINADTLVWRQGMSGWVRAAESPELRSLFPALAPSPLPVAPPPAPPPLAHLMASPLAGKQRSWGKWSAVGIGVLLILCAVYYLSNRSKTASMTFEEFGDEIQRTFGVRSIPYRDFIARFGEPDKIQCISGNYIFYYRCKEGMIQLRVGIWNEGGVKKIYANRGNATLY